ncbi:Kinase, NEK [Giardia lamblia P15]|uniref:non-specific serine/threonine protein kinase n=1 Tax=Giardia intestinalis (strain P15) TaxID=658858 RepID=E1EZC5_GIAIA|nr:Kinase, NEK [Giardia lamblia P15]
MEYVIINVGRINHTVKFQKQMHPVLSDRYEIFGQITRSRCSVVMLAVDNTQEEAGPVVVKKFVLPLPTEKLAQAFEAELLMARSLKNKYLVPYFDTFFEKQWAGYFAIMPYYKSQSLYEQIRHRRTIRKPFEEASIWVFLASMMDLFLLLHSSSNIEGFSYPHNCVIRPDNIFVSKYGIFQLHRFHLGKYDHFRATKPKLTPCYHAPEVIGGKNWSIKSDVWSVACIAYEMCTLRPLYELLDIEELFGLIKDARPTFNLRGYSREMQDLLSTMLDPIANSRASPEYLLKNPTLQHYKEMLVCAGNGVCSCGGDGKACCDLQTECFCPTFVHSNYADAAEALSYGLTDHTDRQLSLGSLKKDAANWHVESRSMEPISSSKSQLVVTTTNKDLRTHTKNDYSITDFSLPHGYTDDNKGSSMHRECDDVRNFSPFDRRYWRGAATDSLPKSDRTNDPNTQSLSVKESFDNVLQLKKGSPDTQGLSMSSRPHVSVDSLMYAGQKTFHYLKDPVILDSVPYENDRQQSHRHLQRSVFPVVTEMSPIQCSRSSHTLKSDS